MNTNARSNIKETKAETNTSISFIRSSKKKKTYKELTPKISLESIKEYKRRAEEEPQKPSKKNLVFQNIEEPKRKNSNFVSKTTKTIQRIQNKENSGKIWTNQTQINQNQINQNKLNQNQINQNKLNQNNLNQNLNKATSGRINNVALNIKDNNIKNKNNNIGYIKINSANISNVRKEIKKTPMNYYLNRPITSLDKNNKKEKSNYYEKEEKKINSNNSTLRTNNNTKIEINQSKGNTTYNKIHLPNVTKYERIIDNRINSNKNIMKISNKNNNLINNKLKEEEDDDWNIDQFKGLQKKTVDVSKLRKNKKTNNRINKINTEFSKLELVKFSKATTVAGRNESGLKKINQDTYIHERNINGILNFNMFGVLDGHGVNGHFVSQFVSKFIISKIKNNHLIKKLDSPMEIYQLLKEKGYQIIASAFMDADAQVAKEKFDCLRSGTTCVIVFQLDEHIICANAGDSRAIMIFDDSNNLKNTRIYPLSYDCKPENPMESKRIFASGGSVEQFIDENNIGVGPYRVFVKGQENPGLAMSRSIGDVEAKTVGVIPNPQIIEYEINPKTKYMIICSDGIWEFITNEEAMNIGKKYYLMNDPLGLCNELTNKSTEIWKVEDIVIDDITVVSVFF